MCHANAALTPKARLRVAQRIVDEGHPVSEVAARFQCSWATANRWAKRYRAGEPMTDRSSRPHTGPKKTPAKVAAWVISLRRRKRLGPLQLAALCGIAASTVHKNPCLLWAEPLGLHRPGHRRAGAPL